MPSNIATPHPELLIWCISWIPGLFLWTWRLSHLLPAGQGRRAAVEGAAIAAVPLSAWAAYALAEAAARAQVTGAPSLPDWSLYLALAQVLIPYAVAGAFAVWRQHQRQRPRQTHRRPEPWWVAAAVAVTSLPFLTPGLFMAQLMLLAGA